MVEVAFDGEVLDDGAQGLGVVEVIVRDDDGLQRVVEVGAFGKELLKIIRQRRDVFIVLRARVYEHRAARKLQQRRVALADIHEVRRHPRVGPGGRSKRDYAYEQLHHCSGSLGPSAGQ